MAEIVPLRPEAAEHPFSVHFLANSEAEQSLLGAILLNNKAHEHVAGVLREGDFATAIHRRIYSAIGKLLDKGIEANPVSLKTAFEQDGALADVGGAAYLGRLAASTISIANAPHYAAIVADLARRRALVEAAACTIEDAKTLDDPARTSLDVLDAAEQRLHDLSETTSVGGPESLAAVSQAQLVTVEAAYKAGGIVTVDTGLLDVDRIVSGMPPGTFIIVGGRPSIGKSAFAGTIAFNVAQRSLDRYRRGETKTPEVVAFFSLEMTAAQLSARWLAADTEVDTDAQRHGRVDMASWQKLIDAQERLAQLPIFVDDQSRLSVGQIRQRSRRLKRRHGLCLIIVDYLQLIRQGGKQESRRVEVGDISSMLKAVAKELDVPVIALSQLGRAVEQRDDKRPQMSDLRESGDLEQDGDVIMLLYREEYYLERNKPKRKLTESGETFSQRSIAWEEELQEVKGLAEVLIPKNKFGRTGVARVTWDGPRQRFENHFRGGE